MYNISGMKKYFTKGKINKLSIDWDRWEKIKHPIGSQDVTISLQSNKEIIFFEEEREYLKKSDIGKEFYFEFMLSENQKRLIQKENYLLTQIEDKSKRKIIEGRIEYINNHEHRRVFLINTNDSHIFVEVNKDFIINVGDFIHVEGVLLMLNRYNYKQLNNIKKEGYSIFIN